jgi:cell wall-associated NlpC family hydrolase
MRRILLCLLAIASVAGSAAGASASPPAVGSDAYLAREDARDSIVAFARHQIGVRYTTGGTTRRTGYDCSGLVFAAYRSIGRKIPHTTWKQLAIGMHVARNRLEPGDLIFSRGGGHVALVVSKTRAISSPRPGLSVHYVSLKYFRGDFAGARRLLN